MSREDVALDQQVAEHEALQQFLIERATRPVPASARTVCACGEEIDPRRRKAMPGCGTCIRCQRMLDGASVRRSRW
ncbi:hypothetical protein [Hydrocarboniphaga sp.]|uniref:hypothetical protein n=1 Tax=Hydrocarboniphaga sp. TaxID=2033016 RepID=UPI003D11B718